MRRLLPAAVALALFIPSRVEAVYQCGAQTDTCKCGAYDPYPCCSNGGNCTWWAWEAACCNWGIGLPGWGNANQWQGNARAQGYDIRSCNTPVVNTIANRVSGQFGHVAWVTALNGGGGVHVEEQNCDYGPGSMDQANYGVCWFDGGFIARGGQVQCNPGDSQVQGCGACGTQSRGCGTNGQWGGWSGCSNAGSCSPGQTETQGCGNCGTQTRTCGGNCEWGGWSACTGEGECSPGQTDTQNCCDCGTQQRVCTDGCHWNTWSDCSGPDPVGPPSCDTGVPGACAAGQQHCVSGCLTCVQLHQPSPELCDDFDNNCNGQTDEGDPQQLGNPPAAFAATLIDASFPQSMEAGATTTAWVVFRNDGTTTWLAGQVSLRADAPAAGTASRLEPEQGWPAFDTPAVLDHDVAPGDSAAFSFPIAPQAGGDIDETFTMRTPAGLGVACPNPTAEVKMAVQQMVPLPEASLTMADLPAQKKKAGCATVDGGMGALLLALLARRRRR